jgi:hypothetical protein
MDLDHLTVLFAIGAVCVFIMVTVLLYQRHKKEQARFALEAEKNDKLQTQLEAKARQALKDAVEAGTHLPTGHKRCLVEECPLAATKPGIVFARGEGWQDYVKRLFGAPPRYTVKAKKKGTEPDLCEGHQPLAREVAKERLARHEQKRVTLMMEEEAELAHFEHVGLISRTSELAKKAREMGGRVVSIQQRRVGG